jgi:hypothetical protein
MGDGMAFARMARRGITTMPDLTGELGPQYAYVRGGVRNRTQAPGGIGRTRKGRGLC